MLFMGIDAGTQGVRALVANTSGEVLASRSVAFARLNVSAAPGYYEQRPYDWKAAAFEAIGACVSQLKDAGIGAERIKALCIDGTSGTIVPLGADFEPLRDALMYNDLRAKEEAAAVQGACGKVSAKLGYRFNASFALPRVLWLKNHIPEIYENTRVFAHQADYLAGILTGAYGVTDYSNALKTGYDLIEERWPDCIGALGLETAKLPKVLPPGKPIGNILPKIAGELGLSEKTSVCAGATDGYTSALAAGALRAGDWASVIGTTLVLKGVTRELVIDPSGAAYSHKLPGGAWMPGGASSIGGRCLNERFDKSEFGALNKTVDELTPTGIVCYPLTGAGERFPFVDPDAKAFFARAGEASREYVHDISASLERRVLYAALMEGVGFAERLCFARMEELGCEVGDTIYTSGGACKSPEWLRVRASILNKRLRVPAVVDAAMGSAMLAASETLGTLENAGQMLRFSATVEPVKEKVARYDALYQAFYEECRERFKL